MITNYSHTTCVDMLYSNTPNIYESTSDDSGLALNMFSSLPQLFVNISVNVHQIQFAKNGGGYRVTSLH